MVVFCFSDSFVQKTIQQSDGSCNVTIDSQLPCKRLKNSFFVSTNTEGFFHKKNVSKEYCIARHDAETCFLLNCRYHISFLGNVEKLLQKLEPLCFTYQHVDCLYFLFTWINYSSIESKEILLSGEVFLRSKVFYCNYRLIPQSRKLVEICFSHCKILY